MTNIGTLPRTTPTETTPVLTELSGVVLRERETTLRDLLGADYEYAYMDGTGPMDHEGRRQGSLINMFYINPETQYDGLLHTLTGDIMPGDEGIVPGGFHHEPSAQNALTYVERDHLAAKNSKDSRQYREVPFNEYNAHIVVDGFRKTQSKTDPQTGVRQVKSANNGMYPKEYDALSIMQTIRQAVEQYDGSQDSEAGTIVYNAKVPKLDGQSMMELRVCLDAHTKKVISAYPRVGNHRMDLSPEETNHHLGL